MSLWWVIGIIIAFVLGLAIGGDEETVMTDCDRCQGRNWHIWIEPTDDPSRYRAKYTDNGRVKYNVQDNGVSNTLESLAAEIDGVDVPSNRETHDLGYE